MSADLVLRSRRVVIPGGETSACVVIRDGIIADIISYAATVGGAELVDIGDLALLPGVVDTHVHLNDPGRASWEGFETGTRAAAAGGVTTVVDMPLNSVPATTTVAGLEAKLDAARGRCHVDTALWGGVVPGNAEDLAGLWDAGVLGFKCFLSPSGVEEFGHVDAADLVRMLPTLARLGAPLLVHAEMPDRLQSISGDPCVYAHYQATRPPDAEVEAVRMLVDLCRETHVRMHVVHVSSADVLPLLRTARSERLPFTAETCPHYLHFAADAIARGATALKCAPPIRGADDREMLWRALGDGAIDMVASDHSPAPASLKQTDSGDFDAAWGGIASLQLALPVVWTEAAARRFPLHHVARWMSAMPAHIAGLPRKGAIEVGRDADLAVFDPDAEWTVDGAMLQHRHALTPYHGERLRGEVVATYLRGNRIFGAEGGHAAPIGRIVQRPLDGGSWTLPS